VCGDVATYISGSLLVCVLCTVRKSNSEQYNIHTNKTGYFNNCNLRKHE